MAKPQKPHLQNKSAKGSSSSKRKQKKKGTTQKPAFQSIMVMGPTGKTRMEKRPW